MSVRIVEDKPDPSVIKQIICKKCGVKLEYLPIDVKEFRGKDWSGGDAGEQFIDCPKCKNRVVIKSW